MVPETFSFTLQELFELAIPTLATDIGSFRNRITEGVNGFLCAPDAPSIIARLSELDCNRHVLAEVHARLRDTKVRRLPEMLADYESLTPVPKFSAKASFAPASRLCRVPMP